MQPISMIFFLLFAIIITFMYIALRRDLANPAVIAGGGVVGAIIAMTLFALTQGNLFLHALAVGLVVGGAFSIAALALAWYFQGNEMRSQLHDEMHGQALKAQMQDE